MPVPAPAPRTPRPVPAPGARGGDAIPTPKPKRVRIPKPKPTNRTRRTNTGGAGGNQPNANTPYPQIPFPKPYDPAAIAAQARHLAGQAIDAQTAALPTQQMQSAPFEAQVRSEQGLGDALLNALKGAQTYRVDLASGQPTAFAQQAAATGGDATTAQQAAATLASYGTSAANQIAQQEAMAPASTAGNIRTINERLTELLTGPQGHDALARQIAAQQPGLEQQYETSLGNQAQIPFNQAMQSATANANYGLAQQTYGLNQQNAQNTQAYRQQQVNIGQQQVNLAQQNERLRELGLKLATQRASDSYDVAIKRLQLEAKRAAASGNTQDTRAAQQAQAALRTARGDIIRQANTLYKRTQSSGGTWTVSYFTGDGTITPLTPHTETFHTAAAAQARQNQLTPMTKPAAGSSRAQITNLTSTQTDPGTPGQSAGYLRNQAVNYAVTVLQQSAPWMPRAAATRLAQKLIGGVFGAAPRPRYGPPAPAGTRTTP